MEANQPVGAYERGIQKLHMLASESMPLCLAMIMMTRPVLMNFWNLPNETELKEPSSPCSPFSRDRITRG